MLGFVEVPEGPFLMGSDKEKDREAYDDEQPQHEVEVPKFYIGCYPVTVAQYRAFVENSGHKPENPDCLKGLDNHPVVHVTWHESLAYCKWLNDMLLGWNKTPGPLATLLRKGEGGDPWRVILPSEAEWEKAARGADG